MKGKVYTYMNTDQRYEVIHTAQMKIGSRWLKCKVYQSQKDNKIYVREEKEFLEKFKQVDLDKSFDKLKEKL